MRPGNRISKTLYELESICLASSPMMGNIHEQYSLMRSLRITEHVEQVRRGFVHLRVECVEVVGIGLRDNASCRIELPFLHGVLVM